MIHPDTELVFISAQVGRGVRATAAIPRGTVVWARDRFDLVLSAEEVEALPPAHRGVVEVWGYRDRRGRWILCADAGRFVNHSCEPAIRGVGDDLMIAVRDLSPGDEITCDYAECNVALRCACGAPGCRTEVREDDLHTYAERWDDEVRDALREAGLVQQPLFPFVLDPARTRAYLEGHPAPSLRSVCRAPAPSRVGEPHPA